MPEEYVALTKETALAWRETIAKAKQFLSQQEGRGGSASDIVHGVPVELDGWLHPGLTATAYILSWDETGKEWTKTETSVQVADSLGSISPLPPGTRGLIYPAGENVHILVPFAELQRVRLTSSLTPCGVASGELTYVHEGQWQAIAISCYDPLGVAPKEGVPAGQCVWVVYKHDMYRWEVVSWGTCCQEESSSESESSASESEGGGCGGVTETLDVLIATPTRSGDNLILPRRRLVFTDGCLTGVEEQPDFSINLCCDGSSESSSSGSEEGEPCSICTEGTTPRKMEVSIAGVQNGPCEACSAFNGTFELVQQSPDTCDYKYTFDPMPCGNEANPDYIILKFLGSYISVDLWIGGQSTRWVSGTKTSPYDCSNLDEDLSLFGSGKTSPCDTMNATCHIRSL